MSGVTEKFLRYVKVDTESVQDAEQFPSSEKQKDLARLLAEELRVMGAKDVHMDPYGYVYAEIPATVPAEGLPVIGFIAHMDTSPAVSGKDVNPRIVKNYDGNSIQLDAAGNYILSPEESPELLEYCGQDLIVTDGSTLLGADDKAGVVGPDGGGEGEDGAGAEGVVACAAADIAIGFQPPGGVDVSRVRGAGPLGGGTPVAVGNLQGGRNGQGGALCIGIGVGLPQLGEGQGKDGPLQGAHRVVAVAGGVVELCRPYRHLNARV